MLHHSANKRELNFVFLGTLNGLHGDDDVDDDDWQYQSFDRYTIFMMRIIIIVIIFLKEIILSTFYTYIKPERHAEEKKTEST